MSSSKRASTAPFQCRHPKRVGRGAQATCAPAQRVRSRRMRVRARTPSPVCPARVCTVGPRAPCNPFAPPCTLPLPAKKTAGRPRRPGRAGAAGPGVFQRPPDPRRWRQHRRRRRRPEQRLSAAAEAGVFWPPAVRCFSARALVLFSSKFRGASCCTVPLAPGGRAARAARPLTGRGRVGAAGGGAVGQGQGLTGACAGDAARAAVVCAFACMHACVSDREASALRQGNKRERTGAADQSRRGVVRSASQGTQARASGEFPR
jgi:hypothetical protein